MEKHVAFGLLIPVAFIGFTGVIKCLIRKEFYWESFYLGVDTTLAGLANGVVNIVDEVHAGDAVGYSSVFAGKMVYTAYFLVLAIGSLLFVMFIHQKWEDARTMTGNRTLAWRGFWLGAVSNMIGGLVLGVFVYWKLKGIL